MTEGSGSMKRKVTSKKSGTLHAAKVQAERQEQPGESAGSLKKRPGALKKRALSAQAASSPAALPEAVRKLQAEVSTLRRQPGLEAAQVSQLEIIEKRLGEAIVEAQKPQPDVAALQSMLGNARLLLTRLTVALPSAAAPAKRAGGLARLAKKLLSV